MYKHIPFLAAEFYPEKLMLLIFILLCVSKNKNQEIR